MVLLMATKLEESLLGHVEVNRLLHLFLPLLPALSEDHVDYLADVLSDDPNLDRGLSPGGLKALPFPEGAEMK